MEIKASKGKALTAQDEAILEVGKKMIYDSLSVGRDFSKHMMTISATTITVYLAIIGFFFNKAPVNLYFMLPVILLVLAMLIFGISVYPGKAKLSIELIDEVSEVIQKTVRQRRLFFIAGFSLYALSIILTTLLMIFNQ